MLDSFGIARLGLYPPVKLTLENVTPTPPFAIFASAFSNGDFFIELYIRWYGVAEGDKVRGYN